MALLLLASLFAASCTSTGGAYSEGEPISVAEQPSEPEEAAPLDVEGEVPLEVAESEPLVLEATEELAEIIVEAAVPERHQVIHGLVAEAEAMLRNVELQYFFTGKGRREVLRGRPVAFALWSERDREWIVAHIEIPRPPVTWRPGRKPMAVRVLTPGIVARHVKGTGAERLMFAFSRNGEPLKVYGRKFPVFDSGLISRKRWRAVAENARPIVYLPFTEDTLDPQFVTGGRDFLMATARQAIAELRAANAPSVAYPGQLLADVVPAEVISTLAVIEQTDDNDFVNKGDLAVAEVLSHYGLKREEAYRYSVSSASALGAMQFTNRRGNGTYSMVVRRCPAARIDPDFQRGATDLLNAMKAAICLFDIELFQMRADIRLAYRENMHVLGIFPVAAYNGGPRNVTRLYNVLKRMKVDITELRPRGEQPVDKPVTCPCLWRQTETGVMPVALPRYNNENRWYVEKYQNILDVFE